MTPRNLAASTGRGAVGTEAVASVVKILAIMNGQSARERITFKGNFQQAINLN